MAGEVAICNQALGKLGANQITAINEDTVEGRLCDLYYDQTRRAMLQEVDWTFATKRYLLLPVNEDHPEELYDFRFPVPSEVIKILYVSDNPDENYQNDIDWQKEGPNIACNAEKIYMRASYDELNTDYYTDLFKQALAVRLAAEMSRAITRSTTVFESLMKEYSAIISDAGRADGQQGRTRRIRSQRYINVRWQG